MEMFELLAKGGLAMIPIGFASVISVMIAFERLAYYRGQRAKSADFAAAVHDALGCGDYDRVAEACRTAGGAAGEVLLAALAERRHVHVRQEDVVQAAAKKKAIELRRYLEYLSVIVTMAPLLGLLGTVIGMISSFSVLSVAEGEPFAITGGVGEALVATASGLLVAILALSLHAYLSHRANSMIADVEYTATMYLAHVGGERREA